MSSTRSSCATARRSSSPPERRRPMPDPAPRGRYLAGEAGMLAGVSGDRIGQWARHGYIRSSRSDREPRVYSYEDVAEAMIVHELEELGAALPSIRRAVERL